MALGLLAMATPLWSAEEPVKRVYTATPIEGAAPVIDGRLDEPCWSQGEWAGDYIQREPVEGGPATYPTAIKILYDRHNVYVGIRATDPDIVREPRLIGQRDEFSGDIVGIAFDSYHNRRNAFEFDVTSGGSKIDLILRNEGWPDTSWNAIWDVRVAITSTGWTAEYRIPLSQLRYSGARDQVWGMHAWRWLRRKQEESDWQLIPMDNRGFVYAFGELRGIHDLPPSRRIELMPYVVAKYESLQREAGNPFRSGATSTVEGGLDAKIGLSSEFTLDLTLNPDFGQVEADPSEINLGTTETFFPEKRPFFLEGKAMFEYGIDDDLPFYSRRLGRAPTLEPVGTGFVQAPTTTRILSAEKITGRTENGFSLGMLHSVTDRMDAKIVQSDGTELRETVEPLTNYFVARPQQDFAGGNTLVGGIVTAALRQGDDQTLERLPRRALAGGFDWLQYWHDRSYFLDARTLFTQLSGSPEAITAVTTDAVHYFQRPDADYLDVDPTARTLSGNAGRVRVGKGNGGEWRYYGAVSWRSPGVEYNDVGYLMNADYVTTSAQLQYYNAQPGDWLRRRDVRLRGAVTRSYGGETLQHLLRLESEFAGMSNWSVWSALAVHTDRFDTRVLRGGPGLRAPPYVNGYISAGTDDRRSAQGLFDAGFSRTLEDGSYYYRLAPGISQRIGGRVRIDAKLAFERNEDVTAYAGETTIAGHSAYFMAHLDQTSVSGEFRVQANFTPTLSLTYYGGPFASTGRYDRFQLVTSPRAARWQDRFSPVTVTATSDGLSGSRDGAAFRLDNPNFDWRELKSNLVLKWEFRPGSTLYCVWSQHRTSDVNIGEFSASDDFRQLFRSHPDNTFLVKMSYWFSI